MPLNPPHSRGRATHTEGQRHSDGSLASTATEQGETGQGHFPQQALEAEALAPKEGKGLHTCNPKGCLQQERPPPETALGPLLRVQERSSWEKGRDRVYR